MNSFFEEGLAMEELQKPLVETILKELGWSVIKWTFIGKNYDEYEHLSIRNHTSRNIKELDEYSDLELRLKLDKDLGIDALITDGSGYEKGLYITNSHVQIPIFKINTENVLHKSAKYILHIIPKSKKHMEFCKYFILIDRELLKQAIINGVLQPQQINHVRGHKSFYSIYYDKILRIDNLVLAHYP
jgi:hypothetical protein